MANEFTEQLFEAMSIIASAKISNLPYDQTIVCNIVDNVNAKDKNEYTVTDGTSTFVAYSDNMDYRVNTKVYVTIPNNDMLNKKHITGVYVEDENAKYETYISPMNNFVDLTGDLAQLSLQNHEFSLLANSPEPQKSTITVWDSGVKEYRNYTCLGISGEFRTDFPSAIPAKGNYGLGLYITYKTKAGVVLNKVLVFDCSEMFGNPYSFGTNYLQEKIFDIQGIDCITNIQIVFYQNRNFVLTTGENIEYQVNNQDIPNNLFVGNIQIKLGEKLSVYNGDTVRLICNEDLKYRYDKLPLTRKTYLRWIHQTEQGLMVVDENEDIELDDSIMYVDDTGAMQPNYRVHWFQYNLTEGVHDDLAGNFWEPMPEIDNPWERIIVPNDKSQYDRFKVIIEYPLREQVLNTLLNETDEDYATLLIAAENVIEGKGLNKKILDDYVEAFIKDEPLEEDDNGNPIVVDFYEKWGLSEDEYPQLFNNSELSLLKAYIVKAKSSIQYYESNVLTFTNEVPIELTNVDLVKGLQIVVDNVADGHNGVYRLYDETNEIINKNEARKLRPMEATYKSIALGIDSLNQAEEIMWCFPLDNTMIQRPEEGYEFISDDGDEYFEVDAVDATIDTSAAQAERLRAIERAGQVYVDKLGEFTTTQLQEQMLKDISDVPRGDDINAYYSAINTIKANYKLLIEYTLTEEYNEEIQDFAANKGRFGVIRRIGAEIADNEDGEQLIQIIQNFRIKPYYVDNATNNTVICMVKKNDRIYRAETSLHFASLGTSGTEATFFLTMNNEAGYEIGGLTPGVPLYIRPYLYDYNNDRIDFESGVGYTWFSKPVVEDSITMTQVGNDLILEFDDEQPLENGANAILQAQVQYTIVKEPTEEGQEEKRRTVTLTTYLPIPLRISDELIHISGANKVVYNSNGVNPTYYKEAYHIYAYHEINTDDAIWTLYEPSGELEDPTSSKYYPTLSENYELIPSAMYYSNIKTISAIARMDFEGIASNNVVWVQPILIMQNKYGSAMMNNWDGSLEIDESNGTILSAMVGAGIKNEDNTFSGVLMGNVALADEKIGNKTGIGMYGFHHGEQSFGLNVDGTAFFGKAGSGRIEFDGNKGTIRSYNYTLPAIRNVDSNQNPIEDEDDDTPVAGRQMTPGAGLQIDLDDSTISAYGKTGSVLLNTNEYGKPLFVIRDANYDKSSKGNTLFYVSSSSYDPVASKSYDAKYFLQSANYNSVDPSEEDYSSVNGYSTGALFDLERGRLDIHGKAGRVAVHGDNTDTLFQIKGWKDINGGIRKNVLMNVAPNRYYLQSLDYKANVKGFKLDISTGKLMASDLNLKAGTAQNGMIQLSTTGAPYLSITSGTDYVEEMDASGNTIGYASYDAIDLENVDAQFEYDPAHGHVYWKRNPLPAGYYILEDYYPTLYEPLPGDDAEALKMQYYYAHTGNGETDADYTRLTRMYPEDTISFEDSRQPDAPRLYTKRPAPIKLDDSPWFTPGRIYYADAEGQRPVEVVNNETTAKFTEQRDLGLLYKQSKKPIADDGSIGFKEGREYFICTNPTAAEADRKYEPLYYIVPSHDEYAIWESGKYYYRTALADHFALSRTKWASSQGYYDLKSPPAQPYTVQQIWDLTENDFKPTAKTIVHPTTYFYSDKTQTIYFYEDDWQKVGLNETYDKNQYRYGIKYNNEQVVNTAKEIVADDAKVYRANKWYYRDELVEIYDEATTFNPNATYYQLWQDIYIECNSVIEKETNLVKIFKPDIYYRYVYNKPFIPALEFEQGEIYYRDNTGTQIITLCDLNAQPYGVIREVGTDRNFGTDAAPVWQHGTLYYLKSDGTYGSVASNAPFDPTREYFMRYNLGTVSPDESGAQITRSVKLVNITKSRFELKSHNWNAASTGMHFYLSSNSQLTYNTVDKPGQTTGESDEPIEGSSAMGTQVVSERGVGGGYIEGYGAYYSITDNTLKSPKFILDWRAGSGHNPIDVNGGRFKVFWNGRVEMQDMHAYTGRIGSWYIDKYGLYSFNPQGNGGTGLALLKSGIHKPDDSTNYDHPVDVPYKANEKMYDKDLRITVGTFDTLPATSEQVSDTDENNQPVVVTYTNAGTTTGFSVYKNGLMRAYGAIIAGVQIDNAKITNVNITSGKIAGFTISGNKLTNGGTIISGSVLKTGNLQATGGKIGGWTINASSLTNGSATLSGSELSLGSASMTSTSLKVGGTTIEGSNASFAGTVKTVGKLTANGSFAANGAIDLTGTVTNSGTFTSTGMIKGSSISDGAGSSMTGGKIWGDVSNCTANGKSLNQLKALAYAENVSGT